MSCDLCTYYDSYDRRHSLEQTLYKCGSFSGGKATFESFYLNLYESGSYFHIIGKRDDNDGEGVRVDDSSPTYLAQGW